LIQTLATVLGISPDLWLTKHFDRDVFSAVENLSIALPEPGTRRRRTRHVFRS